MIYAINKRTKKHRVIGWPHPPMDGFEWHTAHADDEGWIPWDGGECPLPEGAPFEARRRDGELAAFVNTWSHGYEGPQRDREIVAYRPILTEDTKPEAPERDGEAAAKLCEIYFTIAAEVIGEKQVRIRRDLKLKQIAAQRAKDEAVTTLFGALHESSLIPKSDCKLAAEIAYHAIRDGKIPGVRVEQ